MIDYDDGNDFWLASMFTPGGFGLILLIVAIIFWIIAFQNDQDCAKQTCPVGMTSKLMENECMCITKAVK